MSHYLLEAAASVYDRLVAFSSKGAFVNAGTEKFKTTINATGISLMANPTTFKWTDPAANTDGTAIPPSEITGYVIGVGIVSGTYTINTTVPSTAVSEPIASLSKILVPGTYFAAMQAITAAGNSSFSNEVTFTIAAPIPNPPTGFTVV